MFSFFCFCIWTRHIHQIVACIRNGVDFAIKKTSKSYLQALYNQAFNIVLGGQLQKKYYLCREKSQQGTTGHFLHFFFKVLFKCCYFFIYPNWLYNVNANFFVRFCCVLKKDWTFLSPSIILFALSLLFGGF